MGLFFIGIYYSVDFLQALKLESVVVLKGRPEKLMQSFRVFLGKVKERLQVFAFRWPEKLEVIFQNIEKLEYTEGFFEEISTHEILIVEVRLVLGVKAVWCPESFKKIID